MEKIKTDIVVIGGGPGGYTAAFYAADQGKQVVLVDSSKDLGGTCLKVGCIPSKAYLHATEKIRAAKHAANQGIQFDPPKIDLDKLRSWKEEVVQKLSQGVCGLGKRRGVRVIQGKGSFHSQNELRVEGESPAEITFDYAIIATGSRPALPSLFNIGSSRVMTSTEALELKEIPKRLLVVGGGYIGLELGTVYASLGSEVTLVELLDSLLTGVDPDLIRPLLKYTQENFKEVLLKTNIQSIQDKGNEIEASFDKEAKTFDAILVSVGRIPNSEGLGLENTKIQLDDKGFIATDENQKTNEASIFAIGDVAGGVLLAHTASKEAKICIDTIIGKNPKKEYVVPAVVFTDPEIAWVGLMESEAKEKGIEVKSVRFSWAASGRALTLNRTDGMTKLIVDSKTEKILGVGIVGHGAGELISEAVLAIEMGTTAKDLGNCIHPHPTLSETLMESAELIYGHATHMMGRANLAKRN